MHYSSTRGLPSSFSFEQVALSGLATDGGLFIPNNLPDLSDLYSSTKELSYIDIAKSVFRPFVEGSLSEDDLQNLLNISYSSFSTPNVVKLKNIGQHSLLELFHGPTFAFKDIALQFLGNLFSHFLDKNHTSITLVGATSGDTGSAAIYGVRSKKNIHLFILHPANRISKIQELQMTSVMDSNITNIAIEGTFDNAQAIVKELFSDAQFNNTYKLGAINSINWVRIMAQIPYYFYAAREYKKETGHDINAFCVPTGNFGNIYAGYLAKKMGLPYEKLILATNENNILHRTITTGEYKIKQAVATPAPAMDIQVASNFERYLYDLTDKNTDLISQRMQEIKTGGFTLSANEVKKIQNDFSSHAVTNQEIYDCMQKYAKKSITIDPHTAVGICAADKFNIPHTVCLATAHTAKFGEAFLKATGKEIVLPPSLQELFQKQTSCIHSVADVNAIKDIIITSLHENKNFEA